MSLESQTTSLCLWCVQPVLQSVIAIVLWRRKFHRQFPAFFTFLLVQVAIFAVTFPLYGKNDDLYFWLYWLGEAGNAILGFKVIHEIFQDVFRPYHALQDLGTPVFKWAGAVMLLVSVVVAASNSFTRFPIIHAITTLQRSVRTVQVGLILFLMIFSGFLGMSRKQLSFGIALGFGFFASAELMLLAMYSGKFIGRGHLDLLNMLSYDLAIVIWMTYSFLPKIVRENTLNHLRTQRWENSLADLRQTGRSDSLIPMFEGMVERAFSRNSDLDLEEGSQRREPANGSRVQAGAAGSKAGLRAWGDRTSN